MNAGRADGKKTIANEKQQKKIEGYEKNNFIYAHIA
jgi:hypothetical protein